MFMQRNEESDKLIAHLGTSSSTTKAVFDRLLAIAKGSKRVDFDRHQANLRELYEDRQEAQTRAELGRRFKDSAAEMPLEIVGIVKRVAEEDASPYRKPPIRTVLVDGKKPRVNPPEDVQAKDDETDDAQAVAKAEALAAVVKEAKLHSKMREAGRRVVVSKVQFLRIGYQEEVPGRAGVKGSTGSTVSLYWPHLVHCVSHHSKPDDILSAFLLIAESVGPDGGTWFEVWRREYVEDENRRLVSFGPWRAEMIPEVKSDDDKRSAYWLFEEYPLPTLPWLALYDGMPVGSLYVDEGRDLVRTQLNLNALHSDHLFSMDLHAHPRVVIASTKVKKEGGDVAIGPNRALLVETGDSATTLPGDISDSPMQTSSKRIRQLAIQRRHAAHRYDDESSATVLSGKARELEDQPAREAADERAEGYKEFEESLLLPVLVEVSDYWGRTGIARPARTKGAPNPERDAGVEFRVEFQGAQDYESKEEKERYAGALHVAGAISLARYAFLSGAYASLDEAIEAGLSNEIVEAVPSGGGLAAFTANAFAGAPLPTVEIEDDEEEGGVA